MKKKKYLKYIKRGIVQPLSTLPFHHKAPFRRLLMLNKEMVPNAVNYIAAHFIEDIPNKNYTSFHKHDYDEINLIFSEKSKLVYNIYFEDEIYRVVSPATVFIPKGVRHRAEAILGKGIFVAILANGKYKASE